MIRLFELRTGEGLSQRDIAKIMNVSQGTYNNWENERTQPSIEQLIALAEYFSVSVDYLIGHSDNYIQPVSTLISSDEKSLLKFYRELSEPAKQGLLSFVQNSHAK